MKIRALITETTAPFWTAVFELVSEEHNVDLVILSGKAAVDEYLRARIATPEGRRTFRVIDLESDLSSVKILASLQTSRLSKLASKLGLSMYDLQDAIFIDRVLSGRYTGRYAQMPFSKVGLQEVFSYTERFLSVYDKMLGADDYDVLFAEHWGLLETYLAFLDATRAGKLALSIESTRVGRRFYISSNTTVETCPEMERAFARLCRQLGKEQLMSEAAARLLPLLDGSQAAYDVVRLTRRARNQGRPTFQAGVRFFLSLIKDLRGLFRADRLMSFEKRGTRKGITMAKLHSFRKYRASKRLMQHGSARSAIPKPYVYYPVQVQPEANVIMCANGWHDELHNAMMLAESLSFGEVLLVKEAPVMVGRRPEKFYRELMACPNIVLAKPNIQSVDLIRDASAVVTVSGSPGLEAWLSGKPVVVLGEPYYRFLPGISQPVDRTVNSLRCALNEARSTAPQSTTTRKAFLSAMVQCSFEGYLHDAIWEDPRIMQHRNHKMMANALLAKL